MTSILFVGECMLELRKADTTTYQRGFAGDTYNSAVYAKRWNPQLDVSFFTSVGQDSISDEMVRHWQLLGLDCSHVLRSPDKLPGIYAIDVDEHGERCFSYWRSQSAATSMMQLLEGDFESIQREAYGAAYFSGISMAILPESDRQTLIDLMLALKGNGTRVSYDPNYRQKMWPNTEQARYWNDAAYAIADVVFPGDEDHMNLYGHASKEVILQYLQRFDIDEVVMKCGTCGVFGYQDFRQLSHVPFKPAAQQVDSTAAGDSFAGTYLASRVGGAEINSAITSAMAVAALVVQNQGAITPADVYQLFRDDYESGES